MKKLTKFACSFLALLMLSSVILPSAMAVPRFTTIGKIGPTSGPGITTEVVFRAVNNDSFSVVVRAQQFIIGPNGREVANTGKRDTTVPPRTTQFVYSARITSTGAGQHIIQQAGRV